MRTASKRVSVETERLGQFLNCLWNRMRRPINKFELADSSVLEISTIDC